MSLLARTDNSDLALAPNDLAIATDLLYSGSNFHTEI
jgi:hypothetical protein